jgi:uncharacterized protein (TIGR00251 family)
MSEPYATTPQGLRLAIKVAPRAPRTELTGIVADAQERPVLAIRIKAPPIDAAANAELITFLAQALGVKKADVKIQSGESGVFKLVSVRGDGDALAARARTWIDAAVKS